jgi:hypothetical protein
MGKYSIYTRRIIRVNVDMMWAYVDKWSAVAFFDRTRDSILIDLNSLPGTTHTIPIRYPHLNPLSGPPPVQQRSGKCPTNSGRTPANHGQPG